VKCYRGAGLMPLCLLESRLNCARRLPETVGDMWESPVQDRAGHIYMVMDRKIFIHVA